MLTGSIRGLAVLLMRVRSVSKGAYISIPPLPGFRLVAETGGRIYVIVDPLPQNFLAAKQAAKSVMIRRAYHLQILEVVNQCFVRTTLQSAPDY